MRTSSFWTQPGRAFSQGLIVLTGILTLDSLGHVFVPHSTAYWIGFVLFILVTILWNDIVPTKGKVGTENRRIRFFRLFYQGILLLITLIVLDRIADRIFTLNNGIAFWICFALALVLLSGWHIITSTTAGRRILSSASIERTTFVLCSLIGALVILELFVRSDFSRFHVFGILPSREIITDPRTRFEWNAAGYRDIDHDIEKQPGVTRVLLIGDSFASGYGVAQTDYYPAILRETAGPAFEFIVVAQPRMETVHQINMLRDYGCQFSPDVAVVGIVSNDPHPGGEKNIPPYPTYPDYFRKLESPYSFNPGLLYLFDGTINRAAGRLGRYNQEDFLDALYDPNQPSIELWHPVVKQLGDLATECGARYLYAFTLPEQADYSDPEILHRFERIYTILTEGFAQAGFETTNLFPAYLEHFGDRPFQTLQALPNDAHPNAEVHRWYAEQIWARLEPESKSWE